MSLTTLKIPCSHDVPFHNCLISTDVLWHSLATSHKVAAPSHHFAVMQEIGKMAAELHEVDTVIHRLEPKVGVLQSDVKQVGGQPRPRIIITCAWRRMWSFSCCKLNIVSVG